MQATRASALGYVGGKTIGGVSGGIRGPEPDTAILGADTVDQGIDAAMRSLDREDVPTLPDADQSEIAQAIENIIETAPRRPADLERERLEAMRPTAATPQGSPPSPSSPVRPPESQAPPVSPQGPAPSVTPAPPQASAGTDPATVPRNQLPPRENAEVYALARQAEQDMEIAGDDRGGKVFIEQDQHGSTPDVVGWKSPTAPWYKEITSGPGKMSKERVQVALRKIIADKGLDTGQGSRKIETGPDGRGLHECRMAAAVRRGVGGNGADGRSRATRGGIHPGSGSTASGYVAPRTIWRNRPRPKRTRGIIARAT